MKKTILLMSLILVFFNLHSLDITDPSDLIYYDLELWQEKGYYRHIPELRPYSAQLIIDYLEIILEQGTPREMKTAQGYLDIIQHNLRMDVELQIDTRYGREQIGDTYGTLNFFIRGMINDNLSLWGNVSANAIIGYENPGYYMYYDTLPVGERDMKNVVQDSGTIAGISLFSGSSSIMSYGSPELYMNLGLSRASFGPFQDDGIVISQEAKEQGHYELTWRGENFSYTALMLQLVGTDYEGDNNFSQKYLALHSYNWAPLDWLDLGFFETVVYGNRFEPLYLIPFSYLFYNQGIVGFSDNSLMGLKYRMLIPGGVEFNGVLYVDDVGFNELIKFNFNTKLKIALETGVSWTPDEPWLTKLSLDYTAVFPYMYTHYPWGGTYNADKPYVGEKDNMNIDNYTHAGENLGVTLSPNSDRITLVTDWRLDPTTMVTFSGNYMRHGNSSENLTGADFSDVPNDSSIFDNGANDNGINVVDFNNFLSQPVLEKILQLGFSIQTTVDMPFQDAKRYYGTEFGVGYTFEMIWNSARGSTVGNLIPVPGKNEVNHYAYFMMRVFL
jgi:hypothetical protein